MIVTFPYLHYCNNSSLLVGYFSDFENRKQFMAKLQVSKVKPIKSLCESIWKIVDLAISTLQVISPLRW